MRQLFASSKSILDVRFCGDMNMTKLNFFSMRLHCFLGTLVFLFCSIVAADNVSAAQSVRDPVGSKKFLNSMMIPGTRDLQLIVELSDPSALKRMKDSALPRRSGSTERISERNSSMDFTTAEAEAYRRQVRQSQKAVNDRILQLPGAQIQGAVDIVMNALIVRAPAEHYDTIRQLPGVKKVYFSRSFRMALDHAAAIQNAQGLWTAAGGQSQAGRGVRIGIIDTGIDITNSMFSATGFTAPSGFPKYDTTADRAYTNAKVIVARNYISLLSNAQTIQTAVDESGHGSFVAGCAAGEQVTAPRATISGMAPGAYLGSYKIFGTPGINDEATSAAIVAGINDAVADGMNVISLSLAPAVADILPPEEAPEYSSISNAIRAGVVAVIAAGNSGPMTHTVSSLGSIPGVITVGSVTNSRAFLPAIHTTDPDLSVIGYASSYDGPSVTADLSSTRIVDVETLDGNGLGCSTLSGSLSSSVALIKRGTCDFSDKVANAAAAGATAVVVYNNVTPGIFPMSGLSGSAIPAVMISQTDGAALKQYIDANASSAKVAINNAQTLQAVPTDDRIISSFGSVGPGTEFSIKPDLVAVGEDVYSSTEKISPSGDMYDSSGFTFGSGTSFSTPMVSGAAAAMRGLFPSLGPAAIKSLLTTTATGNLTTDGVHSPNVLQQGSGLLNMGKASAAGAVFSPTSLSFGMQSYGGSLSLSTTLTIENISKTTDRFILGVEPIVPGPTISFSQNTTDLISPQGTASVDISLQISAPSSGGFQGYITLQSDATSTVYRIPYWAGLYVPDSTRVLHVSQSSSGGGTYSDLSDALDDARPGNIIEFDDSETYSVPDSGYVVNANSQGLLLHGITVRAAAGQTPVLDGSNSAATASMSVWGLQNVLFQGLTIANGYVGIDLYQPSPSVPLSSTLDQCTISGNTVGVWIDGGGTIDITHSTIGNSYLMGIETGYYADGTQLTLLNVTLQQNGEDGLDAYGSNVDIFNSSILGNYGPGLFLDYCTGTIDGNTFSQNQDSIDGNNYPGDGIQIYDGNLTVRNNLFDSNTQAGIYLAAGSLTGLGPVARIEQNTIRGNGFYGLYSDASPSLQADGNLIEDNAGGIYLYGGTSGLIRNNIIARSTDTTYGSGVEIANSSSARLVNNTIYLNRLYGVRLTSGTVAVVNSIVYGNRSSDLQGVSSGSRQSSLISVDPKFTNAASDDFSLASGSPAIDTGSNAVSDLPFLDYYGRLRVASVGAHTGQGTVDIGAVEAGSTYPMIFPLVVQGSESSVGEGSFITGLAMFNPTTSAMQVKYTGYNSSGSLWDGSQNPAQVSLGANAQIPIFDDQIFGLDQNGSYLGSSIASSQNPMAGFFLIFDKNFNLFSTGANASPQTATDLVFMRHQFNSSGKARYALFNPGVNTANITATLYDSSGIGIGQPQTASIGPKAQQILNFDAANLASGYVRVQSDRPLSGLEAVENANFLSALSHAAPGSDTQLYFPHWAQGGGYSTRIGIVNSGDSMASLTLNAYDSSGNAIGTYLAALDPGGQLLQSVDVLFGISNNSTQVGYIVAQSDQPGIVGFVDFSFNTGVHVSDVALLADSLPLQKLIFAHVANGSSSTYTTGVALLNPFGTTVSYTISVYDSTGNLKAQSSSTLQPHQKVSKLLTSSDLNTGFFTQPIELTGGHIEVTTDYGLLGESIFFKADLTQLASVPAQSGN
jgi:minor extracellular serine protease Vpr